MGTRISGLIILFMLGLGVESGGFRMWNPKRKSEEQINRAYYCVRSDLLNFSVSNMRTFKELLKRMKEPNLKVPTIHVTGTNGKGSVVRKIGASLIKAGYRVGEYTSPGMLTERENIRLNGKIISQSRYVKYHQICMFNLKNIYKKGGYSKIGSNPVIFCMALQYFLSNKAQIIIVEVFMGGRRDHTNVLNPEVSIITNIALDHSHALSNNTTKILYEKAGIIKEGRPVVFGYDMNRALAAKYAKRSNSSYYFIFPDDMNNFTFDHLNAKIARKALELIQPKFTKLKEKHMREGLKAKLMARLEEIKPERLAKLAIEWNLPKLPAKVYNEFKTNILSIKTIIKEMRQKHRNMTLRVVFSMSNQWDDPQSRIQYIFNNVDYLHLIETTRRIAVPLHKYNFDQLMQNEFSKIEEPKFTFTREETVDGINSIDQTIKEAFKASSLREEDEVLLIWGVFWSSIKLFKDNYEVDIPPKVIPTYPQCRKILMLHGFRTLNTTNQISVNKSISNPLEQEQELVPGDK